MTYLIVVRRHSVVILVNFSELVSQLDQIGVLPDEGKHCANLLL